MRYVLCAIFALGVGVILGVGCATVARALGAPDMVANGIAGLTSFIASFSVVSFAIEEWL